MEVTTSGGDAAPIAEALEQDRENLEMVRNALLGKQGFSSAEYWEETYKSSDRHYDWLGTWSGGVTGVPDSALRDVAAPALQAGSGMAILNLGCGNSRLAEEMHEDGYANITSVDISAAVIEKMRARHSKRRPPMTWLAMDITKMSFADAEFDLVIEKSTFDALYTGASSIVPQAVGEAWRVLRPGGHLVSVTFGDARARRDLFAPGGWAWSKTRRLQRSQAGTEESGRGGDIFVHMFRKALPGEAITPVPEDLREDLHG